MPDLWLFSIRLLGLFSATGVAVLVLQGRPRTDVARLFSALCIGAACYLLIGGSYDSITPAFRINLGILGIVFLGVAASLSSWILMSLSRLMFLEHSRNFTWLIALLVLQVSLDAAFAIDSQLGCGDQLSCHAALGVIPKSIAHWILGVLPSSIKFLFIALGNYWLWKEWREDLLEGRRQFRVFFLFLLNTVAVFLVLAEGYALHFNLRFFPLISEIDVVILTCLLLYLGYCLIVLDRTQLTSLAAQPKETPLTLGSEQTKNESESDPLLIKLLQLMEEQKIYRETGLSLIRLKEEMGMPEYRLRQLINHNLGYRNFSTFLNHYRLQEACKELRSSKLPILTIALSVGFGSITTFNDAFKREFQITPSEYRETA